MPPLAAFAAAAATVGGSIISAAGAAASALASAAVASPLVAAGVGVGGYQVYESTQRAEEARSEAAKARSQAASQFQEQIEFTEKQAGEYYQLSSKQMELQAQAAQIKTLANLITQTRQTVPSPAAPQVFTLPAAKEYSAVEQINQAIGRMLRG